MIKEPFLYNCKYEYCDKEFKPKRRRVQKFCSATCRSKQWSLLNNNYSPLKIDSDNTILETKSKKKKKNKKAAKKETINPVAIGNSALGVAAVEILKTAFTKEDNKTVTYKDFKTLKSEMLGRYHPVNNAGPDEFGRKPYYDIELQQVVYL